MSNNFRIFFLIGFLSLTGRAAGAHDTRVDSLLSIGDYMFEYERFPEAIAVFEDLFEQGIYHEQMLYRLAYMHESLGQYPQSIFYLRRIQWDAGGAYLDEKIAELMQETSKERLSPGEGWSGFQLFFKHNYQYILGLAGLLILIGAGLLLPWWRRHTAMTGTALVMSSLILVVLLAVQLFFATPKGVIMEPTRFYEIPAFAGSNRSLPIGPGATVNIEDENDIWYKISMGQFQSWVPKFVVRKVN